MSDVAERILARRRVVRKSGEIVQGFLVEAPGREPAQGRGPPASTLDDPAGPDGLRLEPGQGPGHELVVETLPLEGEADRRVPVAPGGERRRPRGGHPSVVDEPGPLERFQRVVPRLGPEAAVREPLLDSTAGEVAMAEGARGDTEGLGPAQLPPERPGGLAVERAPDAKPRPHDRACGKEAPGSAVELHLDPVARPLAQRGDDRHYSSGSAPSPPAATAAAAAAALAPLPFEAPFSAASSTTGRSRAE